MSPTPVVHSVQAVILIIIRVNMMKMMMLMVMMTIVAEENSGLCRCALKVN
jgi:hypothetical protein